MKKSYLTFIAILLIIQISHAQWTTSGTNIYNTNTGNVGIGTSSPSYLLSVGGNASSMNGGQMSISYLPSATSGLYAGLISQVIANPLNTSTAIYNGVWGESGDNVGITSNINRLIGTGGSIVHRGTGTITTSMSLYAGGASVSNGGTITTAYGLFINSIKGTGITNSYGIWQSSSSDYNYFAGNVGIGTANPGAFMLAVKGNVHAKQVNVDLNGWSDYVFKKDYALPSLTEVKTYIDKNHHLPEIPSEEQIVKDGLNLGEMNKLLVKKVEELTLYLIEKDKQLKEEQAKISEQDKEIKDQKEKFKQLENRLTRLENSKH